MKVKTNELFLLIILIVVLFLAGCCGNTNQGKVCINKTEYDDCLKCEANFAAYISESEKTNTELRSEVINLNYTLYKQLKFNESDFNKTNNIGYDKTSGVTRKSFALVFYSFILAIIITAISIIAGIFKKDHPLFITTIIVVVLISLIIISFFVMYYSEGFTTSEIINGMLHFGWH